MDLYYEIHGEGQPLVMLHGGGTDMRDWTLLAPLLSRHFKVVTVDARGCGKSPAPTEPSNYIEDVLSLLNHLNIEQVTLVGNSIGGQIATEFSLSYPERVQNLILLSPALSGFVHSTDLIEVLQRVQAAVPDVVKMTELTLASPFYTISNKSPQRGLMVEMTEHNIKKMFEWATPKSIWPKPPAIERLDQLQVRTLFILGTHDFADCFRIADHFRAVPNIHFVEIQGGDHKINLTHSEEVYKNIVTFLEA
ncbi:alpha/beta fold hydrolase [Paenibacillus tyrfis]|uniref:alpha/beta fold hydrolase n=1 Tax=Paenibacillus tyrfis TaxID=1501230 RepID=UPI000B58849F|nr:alpha/beta hydrolase [Paenibacillus tyrfis]